MNLNNYNIVNKEMDSLLKKYLRSANYRNSFSTHVSMGVKKGCYNFDRIGTNKLFNICSTYNGNEGIAEKPQTYSMFRCDFDYEEEGVVCKPLYKMDTFLNHIIPKFQQYIKDFTVNFKPEHSECVILTKNPYIKGESTIKHGIHIVFPSLFINQKDFKIIENKFSDLKDTFGYDNQMSTHAWLLYGQSKGTGKGTYIAEHAVKYDGQVLPAVEYLKNYTVYDENEKKINLSEDVEKHYPRIFSINPNHRSVVDMKHIPIVFDTRIQKSVWDDCDDEVEEYEDEIREVVENYITDQLDDSFTIGDWNGNFLQLKRDKTSLCPTTRSRDHDNRGAYITINKDTGKVYIGCYCNEAKGVCVGSYKKVEMKDLQVNSKVAKSNKSIKLDNIYPDECVNQNDVGSYMPRLNKADIVLVRSNMMTYKTQNLKEVLKSNKYKRVLFVNFRVSLSEEFYKIFGDYGFQLYSDFKGKITGDRIIVQVDSLWKVVGKFDLIVFDEITYTLDHVFAFVKKKQQVWEALNQYIQGANKIIAMDALLDNKTINLFKNNKRSTWVVENKWESFKFKTCTYIDFIDVPTTIKYIKQNLEEWGSLYIPTNSLRFANKLRVYLEQDGINVKLDSSDCDPTPSDRWADHPVFITTPTNIAGVSCNDEFGKTICYFTQTSCSAEMSSQMMFRVRNTKSSNIDVIIKSSTMGRFYPQNENDIKQLINDKDDLILHTCLKLNHIRNEIIEDDYYKSYVQHLKNLYRSKMCFKNVLKGILEAHGMKEVEEEVIPKTLTEARAHVAELDKIKKITTVIIKEEEKVIREDVCKATVIDDSEYMKIDEKYKKTPEERLSLRRYHINKAYGHDITLTESFIHNFEKLIPQYRNLSMMNCDNITEYVTVSLNKHEKDNKYAGNSDRLHEKSNINLMKIWACDNIIKAMGFRNIWDNKTLVGFPYKDIVEFLKTHGKHIRTLFNTNKTNWNKIDPDDPKHKKQISKYVNDRLKHVFNIRVNNKHKGRDAKKNEFIISGLNIWNDAKIIIPKNEYAEELSLHKNFKTLMKKTKVGDHMWKCISSLVAVKS